MATTKTALVSVYNKDGLLDLCKGLQKNNVRILASGGTFRAIKETGLPVTEISEVTKFKEFLGGRVKTLHPAVHGGILARDIESDRKDLEETGISTIDFVICNLYPFTETVAKVGVTVPEAVEEIDIGGVTLLRAAAKNHARVSVLCDPSSYYEFLRELDSGSISAATRQSYALKAFEHTATYDAAISDYFRKTYAATPQNQSPSQEQQYMPLRYGVNPHQRPAAAYVAGGALPFKVLNGSPGYVNLLDALNSWSLVKELSAALHMPAAASFKHCSPAGAAVGVPLSEVERKVFMVDDIDGISESGLAQAYARARGADRMSSFGDFLALSAEVDVATAKIISREVSDGVVAPGYSAEALKILSAKKGGKYCVLQMDPNYEPPAQETRTVYGITLTQHRNDAVISPKSSFSSVLSLKDKAPLPESALRDLTVAAIAVKYTQSNSVGYAVNGQVIGMGAGQQSRIGCVRLAGAKADAWWMHFHERCLNLKFKKGTKRPDKANVLDLLCSGLVPESGVEREDFERHFVEVPKPFTKEEREAWLEQLKDVALSSDAFFPFIDNVLRCSRSGVKYISAPTGSQADEAVRETCEQLGICWTEMSYRLFHH